MDEAKFLKILDLLSDRAKEFVQISDEILDGELALQMQDGVTPTEWQVCATISAFINFIGESERMRYGHYAFDLVKKSNAHKKKSALFTLARMKMFWDHLADDGLTEPEIEERENLISKFIANDAMIKKHLLSKPDMYEEDAPQEQHRDWSIKLRVLGETEAHLLKKWNELIEQTKHRISDPSSQLLETHH